MPHGHDGCNLHGLEQAVVVIAFDGFQGTQGFSVTGGKSNPPAGHVVSLGHGGELAAHVLGARDRQEARWRVAVEADIAISEVMNDEELVLPGQPHHFLKEGALNQGG